MRRANPACVVNLQYDCLFVDKRCYKYSPAEGRVVEQTSVDPSYGGGDRPMSVMDRSSPFFGSRLGHLSPTKPNKSPMLYR